jgi:hypothetical protein
MNDAIRLLRAELLLMQECLDKLQRIKVILQENTNGAEVEAAVQAIQPILAKLSLLDTRKREFLQRVGKTRMTAYAADQPDSVERNTVLHLLQQVQRSERSMRKELDDAKELLKRSKQFVDFHINVITQTAANDTYVPPGAAELENRRGVRMFDTNV